MAWVASIPSSPLHHFSMLIALSVSLTVTLTLSLLIDCFNFERTFELN